MEGNIVKTAEEYRDGRQNGLIRLHLQGPAKSVITQSIMIMQSNKTKEKSALRGGFPGRCQNHGYEVTICHIIWGVT
jgi:hypothetical protein